MISPLHTPWPKRSLRAFPLCLLLAACNAQETPYTSTELEIPSQPLRFGAATACYIDADCQHGTFCFQNACSVECADDDACSEGAVCSSRGRCIDQQARDQRAQNLPGDASLTLDDDTIAEVPSLIPNVSVLDWPASIIEIPDARQSVTVEISTDRPVLGGSILYRIENAQTGEMSQTFRAEGPQRFSLELPTGTAALEQSSPQSLNVVTSVGAFQLTIRRQVSTTGLYEGAVQISQFGGGRIPLQAALVVEPADATWESATHRELLLEVSPYNLFSPRYADASTLPYWMSSVLQYDSVNNVWYASFSQPFALPTTSLFQGASTIQRSLRIEVWDLENGSLQGAISDRWTGMFAERNDEGVSSLANVAIEGSVDLARTRGLRDERSDSVAQGPIPAPPALPPLPAVQSCNGGALSDLRQRVAEEYSNADDSPCVAATSLSQFQAMTSEVRAECALALGDVALAGPTTAKQVRSFLNASQSEGISFATFLERCARQDGFCEENPAIECAKELTAFAYQAFQYNDSSTPEIADAQTGALLENYQILLQEGFLGRQLAAYQQDTQTRLQWLRTAAAPLFLAADLRRYNEDILNKWEREVLNAHYEVLSQQFTASALEVLGRAPTDATAIAVRADLLLELSQSWQTTMEAVELATKRWNELYQNDMHRAQAATSVQQRLFELYVSAGTLAHLNYRSGTAAYNTTFGSGFASLHRAFQALAKPFNDLIYMRDGEVALSTSVDPQANANTLLKDLELLARQSIRDAQNSVDTVLAEASETELNTAILRDQAYTQHESLRSELINLCGLPPGCTAEDIDIDPACRIRTELGECGLRIPMSIKPEDIDDTTLAAYASTSEAGRSLLDLLAQAQERAALQEEYRAHVETIRIHIDNARAFKRNIDDWDAQRRAVNNEVDRIVAEMAALDSALLESSARGFQEIQAIRHDAYRSQGNAVREWAQVRIAGAYEDFSTLNKINTLNMRAANLHLGADIATRIATSIAEGIPDEATSLAGLHAIKSGVLLAGTGVFTALSFPALAQEHKAASYEADLELSRAIRDAEVTQLQDLASLNAQLSENSIQNLADDLRLLELQTEQEKRVRESLINAFKRSLELDIAYDLDLQELRDRQAQIHILSAETPALLAQLTRGDILITEKFNAYQQVSLSAQLLEGRYLALNARMNNIENLLGSPAVIFSFANRLASGEARLDRAKTIVYDWLVALEYYAVRPFVSQRIAILLARNPQQLEAIANDLLRLQRVCGGIVNYSVADVSVRDHLLGLNREALTEIDGQSHPMAPAERFRALLRRGNIPISTRVRYTSDESIGDLIASRSVLAATFPIRLSDFANLPQTCNAKIASIGVQLIGDNLPSESLPTVSVLYDGTSELRSCQPHIDTIVGALDPGATNFGATTRFRVTGRSVTPVAGVGAYTPASTDNRGLEGLPLSSTYTLLIDPSKGDNRFVPWSQLEDIRLRITYAYQDVFPMGQCE